MQIDLPIFSAAEVAEIIGVKPSSVRDWRDRGLGLYIGTKTDHRVEYSVREAAIAAIVRDLVHLNFPLHMAAEAASALVEVVPEPGAVFRGNPDDIGMLTPAAASAIFYREKLRPPDTSGAEIVLQVGAIWTRILERATAVHSRGAASDVAAAMG